MDNVKNVTEREFERLEKLLIELEVEVLLRAQGRAD